MDKEIQTIKQEIKKLKFLAEELADIPYGSIDNSSRKRKHAIARNAAAAFVICEMGLSFEQARDYFNRHRTSFYHYKKRHIDFMQNPKIYPEYCDFYNQLAELYLNNEDSLFKSKRTFEFFKEIEKAQKEQKAIQRKLEQLDREYKMLGL